MTARQERFVAEYPKDLNATKAAIRAGYSAKSAGRIGTRLSTNVHIAALIATKTAQQLAKVDVTVERTLQEIARVGFSNAQRLFDGPNLKDIHELREDDAAAISSVEVIIKNAAAGDQHTDTIHKVKMWDKMRALELLAEHLQITTKQSNVTVHVVVVERLHAARERAKQLTA